MQPPENLAFKNTLTFIKSVMNIPTSFTTSQIETYFVEMIVAKDHRIVWVVIPSF